MSSMNFSGSRQFVKPPQRGIFPLDHDADCKEAMNIYLDCLKQSKDLHYKCKDLSKQYLQCRMDNELMSKENLNNMGYSEEANIKGTPIEYDKSKEKQGFIAGKHINKKNKWWFQKPWTRSWEE